MSMEKLNDTEHTVLVTGGSGYLGGWAVIGLLRQGYRVRATLRNLAREGDVRATIATQVDAGDRLSFVAADLLSDEGWDRATKGATYVLHVASPMPVGEFRGQDIIRPAREGTRRVLEAAAKAGVKRVVLTSSTAAAMPEQRSGAVADETVWTDLPPKAIYNYPRSKTLAEQDAWAFVRKPGATMELTTILPGQIQGPVLGSDYSASIDIVRLMLNGRMPLLPRIGFGIVDVRDLVDLHILAMTSPAAAGERFIASGDFLWFSDIARLLREHLGAQAAKVPTRILPDLVVRLGGLFNAEMAQLAPNLGQRTSVSSAKAERVLGWRTRAAHASIIDAAMSLIARGLV
jgi:dihydroflavonol-4-reductase